MGKFAAGLIGIGTVLRGLSGTREGYQLDYASNHLFYEASSTEFMGEFWLRKLAKRVI